MFSFSLFWCHFLSINCVCSPRASDLFPRLLATPPPSNDTAAFTPPAHAESPHTPPPCSPSLTPCTWPNPPRWAATTRLSSHLHPSNRQPTHCSAISAEHTKKDTSAKTINMMLTAHLLLHTAHPHDSHLCIEKPDAGTTHVQMYMHVCTYEWHFATGDLQDVVQEDMKSAVERGANAENRMR